MPAPTVTLSDKLIEKLDPQTRKEMGVRTRDEISAKINRKSELAIQNDVEGWLRINGFWPRTPGFLDGKKPEKGWYIHLHQTKKNPIILDLLIFTHDGRCLELELKTENGPIREHQQAILNTTECSALARSTVEAITKIKEWLK